MSVFSVLDLAIAEAIRRETIRVVHWHSRFGDTYATIRDEYGLIEVTDTVEEAHERIEQIRSRTA